MWTRSSALIWTTVAMRRKGEVPAARPQGDSARSSSRSPPPKLPALGVAAIQAGGATVHHHHRRRAAFRAELCAIGKMRLRKGIGLFGACFELCALFLDEFALMHIELRLLEQTDGL